MKKETAKNLFTVPVWEKLQTCVYIEKERAQQRCIDKEIKRMEEKEGRKVLS